jgi:GNAT superfamily N-acetyltransferase
MEDQKGEFYVDTQDGVVAGGLDDDIEEFAGDTEDDRYIPLPEWDSSEGFRLMERFAAGFRNPPIQEKLTAALDRGRGVFRAFKDVLSAHPEAEQLWFGFKEREMRRVIMIWYNGLREEWGLGRIGSEPEETEDLVLEDFRFREAKEKDTPAAVALHALCTGEFRESLDAGTSGMEGLAPVLSGQVALVAETGNGDFAGYIASRTEDRALHITALEVEPEYRGLGLGEALLARMLGTLDTREIAEVFIDLPEGIEGFSRVLIREAFEPFTTRYRLKVTPSLPNQE